MDDSKQKADPSLTDLLSWTVAFQPMNVWECNHKGCHVKAVGCGGAHGLIAIGWYFRMGGPLFCPLHRPDPVERHMEPPACKWWVEGEKGGPREKELPCSVCKAEAQAMTWQKKIIAEVQG